MRVGGGFDRGFGGRAGLVGFLRLGSLLHFPALLQALSDRAIKLIDVQFLALAAVFVGGGGGLLLLGVGGGAFGLIGLILVLLQCFIFC